MNTPSQLFQRRPLTSALLGGMWALAFLLGHNRAEGATAYCEPGEIVRMTNASVTLIAGPGDPIEEQARWLDLDFVQLRGPLEIVLGQQAFIVEEVP